jgi:hydrogenase-4 membrane subunit HyfE
MAVDEQVKLAFASVTDLTKQLITLGTAVLTLQASFAKVFFEKAVDKHWQGWASWSLLLLSVVAGIWVLMATTGTLAADKAVTGASIYAPNIRLPAFVQVLLFIAGMGMSIWFGVLVSR